MSQDVKAEQQPEEEIDKSWLEECIRETDHYYQGEMRQEERVSWLLATSSALIAVLISSSSNIFGEKDLSPWIFLIPIPLFFISAVIAILGIFPYTGIKGIGNPFKMKPDFIGKPGIEFVKEKLNKGKALSPETFEQRVFYHLKSHYIRNYQKSQMVIWSSIFLLLGLLSSFFLVICPILNY